MIRNLGCAMKPLGERFNGSPGVISPRTGFEKHRLVSISKLLVD